jgi:hypothetical protein
MGLAGAALMCGQALAADHEAGVPLSPAEAAGPWTVESGGRPLCVLTLGVRRSGAGGFALRAPDTCEGVLTGRPTAWSPTADGMKLVGADGATLVSFNRWSNSLFVSHMSSGVDIQLQRGR